MTTVRMVTRRTNGGGRFCQSLGCILRMSAVRDWVVKPSAYYWVVNGYGSHKGRVGKGKKVNK